MFKNFKRCVSAAVATAVMLTSVLSTSVVGKTLSIVKGTSSDYEGEIPGTAIVVTATADKESVKPGQEVVVTFSIKNNPADGFGGYSFTVDYDSNVLEPTGTAAVVDESKCVKTTGGKIGIPSSTFANVDFAVNMIEGGTDVVKGDGILFAKSFKVKEDCESGSTSVILKNKGKDFLASQMGTKYEAYTVSADISVKGSVPAAPQKIVKIEKGVASDAALGDINEASDIIVSAASDKEKVKNGETFIVTFSIKNNPADGFGGYSFTVDYDKTMFEATGKEAVVNEADCVKTTGGKIGIPSSTFANVDFAVNMIEGGTDVVKGDGILFAKEFKAIGNEVSGNITLLNKGKDFLASQMGTKYTAFSKGAVITITDEGDEESSSSTTESTTEATTEATTEESTEASTEDTTSDEDNTEKPTEKPTERPTEGTTETPTETTTRRSSGGGGGSPKKHDTVTTEKRTTEKATEKTTEDSTSKPSEKPTTKPTTPTNTSKGVSFVTKSGLTVNVPRTDSSKTKEFADVKALTPWANAYITKLTAAGIINGVSDTAFNPKGSTKRGDFMVMIAKLLGLEGTPSNNFSDVPKDKYYYNAIGLTKQIGIAAGVGADKFDPEATITREQVMAITYRVLDLVGAAESADLSVLNKFSDKDNISNYAKSNIASLVAMGIVTGDTAGKINPTANITRAETAVIMCNVYDIVFDKAMDEAEMLEAATEKATESTTEDESASEDETSSDEDSAAVSKALSDYEELLEYIAAFTDYALDDSDDQGKTLNERFDEDYRDDYTQVYNEMDKYLKKYEDADEIDLEEFAKDTTDFYNTIKDFGDEIDLAVTSDDAKAAIKSAKSAIEKNVEAAKKALSK